MPLKPIVALRGSSTLLDYDPMIETYRDILYVPAGYNCTSLGGVYDRGRKVISASGYYRADPDPVLLGQAFTTLDPGDFPMVSDDFNYVFLGQFTGHYGHFVMGSMARLWAARIAPDPNTRYVIVNREPVEAMFDFDFIKDILHPLGITSRNVVTFPSPVRLPRLVVPSPAVEEHNFTHSVFGSLCAWIGRHAAASAPVEHSDSPVFLSKLKLKSGVTQLLNEDEFCGHLERRGVDVVYPEKLGFTRQIALLRDRPVVTGMLGSGLHTSVFAPPADMIALSLEPTALSNQALLDRASGWRTSILYPQGGVSTEQHTKTFQHVYKLSNPQRTADEFMRQIERVLQAPPSSGRRVSNDAEPFGVGRVLFDHSITPASADFLAGQTGWHAPEHRHVWTSGPFSTLDLPRPETDGFVQLSISAGTSLCAPHLLSRPLTVTVNGIQVATFQVNRTSLYQCVLPAACLRSSRLHVGFRHPITVSPASLGINDDTRPLSIMLYGVSLRETLKAA